MGSQRAAWLLVAATAESGILVRCTSRSSQNGLRVSCCCWNSRNALHASERTQFTHDLLSRIPSLSLFHEAHDRTRLGRERVDSHASAQFCCWLPFFTDSDPSP
uniref:Putative secreted protein n=1 Tax=Anopheles marajoara TaxID=58244 RepID=A0A2M4C8M8_9DIPT